MFVWRHKIYTERLNSVIVRMLEMNFIMPFTTGNVWLNVKFHTLVLYKLANFISLLFKSLTLKYQHFCLSYKYTFHIYGDDVYKGWWCEMIEERETEYMRATEREMAVTIDIVK